MNHPSKPTPTSPEAICALARATRPHTYEPLTDDAKSWVVVKEAPDLEWHNRKVERKDEP
jgi:hypothetical protein